MMIEGMIRLLNMSFTAGCTVVLVLVLRLLFRKLPKGYSYALWLIVLFRFLCPVTLPSPMSLLPVSPEPMPQEIVYEQTPEITTGVIWVDQAVNQVMEENLSAGEWGTVSINPIQIMLFVLAVFWQAGMLVLFLYYMVGILRLRRRLATAIRVEKGIYESDSIGGAFVIGLFRPAIYLPSGLSEENRGYILKHEMVHIRRKDYLVKLLGLCMVMVHWFNPLAWLSFRLLCKDMEMSCDEQVLKNMGQEEKKSYSLALLHAAEQQSGILLPLAFGESHTRSRIKNIFNYRKPRFWIGTLAVVAVVAAAVGLMTNPVVQVVAEETMVETGEPTIDTTEEQDVSIIGGADGPTSIFIAGKNADGTDFSQIPDTAWLASQQIPAAYPGQKMEGQLILDYASKDRVIFHGDFGLFVFEREGDQWNMSLHVTKEEFPDFDKVIEMLVDTEDWKSKESIHPEDKLVGNGSSFSGWGIEEGWREVAANRMADGDVAVIGGYALGETMSLVDLFYGYYNPEEQIFHQVYLFGDDRTMKANPKGNMSRKRYLFSRDGYDYYLRVPESLLEFEQEKEKKLRLYLLMSSRMELIRCQGQEETVLNNLVSVQDVLEKSKIIVTENRIVFTGAKTPDVESFQNPGLISIALDGSDRRAADIPNNVYRGLSYDGEYIYYEGWAKAGEYPRPLYRMTPDFEKQEFLADINGSLVTVKEGGIIYIYNQKSGQIEICEASNPKTSWSYDQLGEDARHYQVEIEIIDGKSLIVRLKSLVAPYETEEYRIME